MNNIITFNGQGCSGKTTQAKEFVETKSGSSPRNYKRIHSHKLRSAFEDKVYNRLGRKHENIRYSDGRCQKLSDVEVLGIPTLAWLIVHFHLNVKPLLLKGTTVVLDHYLGDYYANMLVGIATLNWRVPCAVKVARTVRRGLCYREITRLPYSKLKRYHPPTGVCCR